MKIEIKLNDPRFCSGCYSNIKHNSDLISLSEVHCLLFPNIDIKKEQAVRKLESGSEIHEFNYIRPQECVNRYGL